MSEDPFPPPPPARRARRVFVALLLGAEAGARAMGEVTAALGGEEKARRAFRLPRSEGLHATLCFLGDVAEEGVEGLRGALAREIEGCAAPRLRLGATGAFPRRGRERVLWIGVEEAQGSDRLARLHRRVFRAVRGAGLGPDGEGEEPLRAHVTVARPRNPRRPGVPADFYALHLGRPWQPLEVALVESVRTRGPNIYRPLALVPLAP